MEQVFSFKCRLVPKELSLKTPMLHQQKYYVILRRFEQTFGGLEKVLTNNNDTRLITWNARGANRPEFMHEDSNLITTYNLT